MNNSIKRAQKELAHSAERENFRPWGKKKLAILMMMMAVVLPASFVSCSDAEDGEDWDTWVMRNMLDSKWSLDRVKVNGEYVDKYETDWDLLFDMNLKASGRTFTARRSIYTGDETVEPKEVNKSGTYTVDGKSKAIEATDSDGNRFFRLSNIEFGTGSMTCTLFFYDLNRTCEVMFARSY